MLKLMYITNRPEVARIATQAGVDRIFIDLETLGKAARQGGMDTVQSRHTVADVARMRQALPGAELLVRTNPLHAGSQQEIDAVVQGGANVLMLPFFKSPEEPRHFIRMVAGRARVCLLLETPKAVECLDEILRLRGIDEMFIGLNDLHLGYGMKFMFELLADGTVDRIAAKFKAAGLPFGFGGIAKVGSGTLPAERIIRDHYRLGSSIVILSRSFCNTDQVTDLAEVERQFRQGVETIRAVEREAAVHSDFFRENHQKVEALVEQIVTSV